MVVEAPGEHLLLIVHVEAVVVTGEDVDSLASADSQDLHGLVGLCSRGIDENSAELARFLVSPGEYLAVLGER